mmetsp:Transcript_28076/g.53467  ORF Transcript_28076/g.53467 Transcript_28076/m.53467 type:complete len:1120 (-) Transcript_28076:152-3511(-)
MRWPSVACGITTEEGSARFAVSLLVHSLTSIEDATSRTRCTEAELEHDSHSCGDGSTVVTHGDDLYFVEVIWKGPKGRSLYRRRATMCTAKQPAQVHLQPQQPCQVSGSPANTATRVVTWDEFIGNTVELTHQDVCEEDDNVAGTSSSGAPGSSRLDENQAETYGPVNSSTQEPPGQQFVQGSHHSYDPWEVRIVVRKSSMGSVSTVVPWRTQLHGTVVVNLAEFAHCEEKRVSMPMAGGRYTPWLSFSIGMHRIDPVTHANDSHELMSLARSAIGSPREVIQPSGTETPEDSQTSRLYSLANPLTFGWLRGWRISRATSLIRLGCLCWSEGGAVYNKEGWKEDAAQAEGDSNGTKPFLLPSSTDLTSLSPRKRRAPSCSSRSEDEPMEEESHSSNHSSFGSALGEPCNVKAQPLPSTSAAPENARGCWDDSDSSRANPRLIPLLRRRRETALAKRAHREACAAAAATDAGATHAPTPSSLHHTVLGPVAPVRNFAARPPKHPVKDTTQVDASQVCLELSEDGETGAGASLSTSGSRASGGDEGSTERCESAAHAVRAGTTTTLNPLNPKLRAGTSPACEDLTMCDAHVGSSGEEDDSGGGPGAEGKVASESSRRGSMWWRRRRDPKRRKQDATAVSGSASPAQPAEEEQGGGERAEADGEAADAPLPPTAQAKKGAARSVLRARSWSWLGGALGVRARIGPSIEAAPRPEPPSTPATTTDAQPHTDAPKDGDEEREQLERALALSHGIAQGHLGSAGKMTRVPSAASLRALALNTESRPASEVTLGAGAGEPSLADEAASSREHDQDAVPSGVWEEVQLHSRPSAPPADATCGAEHRAGHGDVGPSGRDAEEASLTHPAAETTVTARVFLAGVDQRGAGGPGACSVLAVKMAEWLLAHPGALPVDPAAAQLDAILRGGVAEWLALCQVKENQLRFPDLHFDLETALGARPIESGGQACISTCASRSFVGFLQPEGLAPGACPVLDCLLEGVMPLHSIWLELVRVPLPATFLVSWNDHFFVLHLPSDGSGCFLIDSLGERLHEGCNRAYILHFDASDGNHGVTSCALYLEKVVAQIPLKQLVEDVQQDAKMTAEGKSSKLDPIALLRLLQIEFQYVVQR